MVSGRTLVHAVAGAVVSVALSFVPFSTAIGGALAGFLEGPDGRDGAFVGALSGAITTVPLLVGALFVFGFLGVGFGFAAVPLEGIVFALVAIVFVFALVALLTVVPALLGGYVGASLAREYPEKRVDLYRTVGREPPEPTDRRRRAPRGPGEPREPRGRYESREWRDPSRTTLEDDGWSSADESVPSTDRSSASSPDEETSAWDDDEASAWDDERANSRDDRDRERTE